MFGEVGLAGEVRGVAMAPARLAEIVKLGFKRCLMPKQNAERLRGSLDIEIVGVSHLREAMASIAG